MQSRAPGVEAIRYGKTNVWAAVGSGVAAIAFFVGLPTVIFFGPTWLNHMLAWAFALLTGSGAVVFLVYSCMHFRAYKAGEAGKDEAALLDLLGGFFLLLITYMTLNKGLDHEWEGTTPSWLNYAGLAALIGLGFSGGLLLFRQWVRRVAREALKEKDEAKPSPRE